MNALVNPAKAISMGLNGLGNPSDRTIGFGVDTVLHQLYTIVLPAAGVVLDQQPGGAGAYADRVRARGLIADLTNWIQLSMVLRSGSAADQPLTVPERALVAAHELAEIGPRLLNHQRELQLQHAPAIGDGPATSPQELDSDPLVTLDQASAVARIGKRTARRYAPEPDRVGGKGRANLWRWSRIREALLPHARVPDLPKRFPG